MSKYDIVKRCNNKLETARDLINKCVKEGSIVAVGSNEYASTYDMNYLFPDMREQFAGEDNHTLEFVNNKVAKASYENKSANRLALEASNILSQHFNVSSIVTASRDNENLFVTAELLHNDMRDTYSFNFSIDNEKVSKLNYVEDDNCERYTVAQLFKMFGENDSKVAQYLAGNNKNVAGGYVYSYKTLKANLTHYISLDNVHNMIDGWVDSQLVSKLNSTTYASKYSLNELIRKAKVDFLSKQEVDNIKIAEQRFGNEEKFYSYETKDNDTRNKQVVAEQKQYIANVKNEIDKYMCNYDLKMFFIGMLIAFIATLIIEFPFYYLGISKTQRSKTFKGLIISNSITYFLMTLIYFLIVRGGGHF